MQTHRASPLSVGRLAFKMLIIYTNHVAMASKPVLKRKPSIKRLSMA